MKFKRTVVLLNILMILITYSYAEGGNDLKFEGIWCEKPIEGIKKINKYLVIEKMNESDYLILHIDFERPNNCIKGIGKINKEGELIFNSVNNYELTIIYERDIDYSETLDFYWMFQPTTIFESFIKMKNVKDINLLM